MITTILLFIVILGLLVFVHELGHFFIARRMGMAVEEFGFGFPPRLFGIKRNGTIYSLNWIPIGGFVRIKGEQGDRPAEADSFSHKRPWRRFLVLIAGVTMNIFLAYILITIGHAVGLPTAVTGDEPEGTVISGQSVQVVQISEGSPADASGMTAGDRITAVGGQEIQSVSEFQEVVRTQANAPVEVTVRRGETDETITVTPTDEDGDGAATVGVWLAETAIVRYPILQSIWEGAKTTVSVTWQIIAGFYGLIKNLITAQPISADIAGPVGVAALTGQVAKLGFIYILQFTALLSINLAIINVFPFPALDGGRILFVLLEKIRGKPVNRRIEGIIHNVGFFILIALIALVTFRDIGKFSDSFRNIF